MTPHDFIARARKLAAGANEAEWRSAVSRAYYAAFHGARDLLSDVGFIVPRADAAHQYLYTRLNNCGDFAVQSASTDLDGLRLRHRADYDWHVPFTKVQAQPQADTAERIVVALEAVQSDPLRTRITDAIKLYERDVLKTVTWRP